MSPTQVCAVLGALLVCGSGAPMARATPTPTPGQALHRMIAERLGGTAPFNRPPSLEQTTRAPAQMSIHQTAGDGVSDHGKHSSIDYRAEAELRRQSDSVANGHEGVLRVEFGSPPSDLSARRNIDLPRWSTGESLENSRHTDTIQPKARPTWSRQLPPVSSAWTGFGHTKQTKLHLPERAKYVAGSPQLRDRPSEVGQAVSPVQHSRPRSSLHTARDSSSAFHDIHTAYSDIVSTRRTPSPEDRTEHQSDDLLSRQHQSDDLLSRLLDANEVESEHPASDTDTNLAYQLRLANLDSRQGQIQVFAPREEIRPYRRRVTQISTGRWPNRSEAGDRNIPGGVGYSVRNYRPQSGKRTQRICSSSLYRLHDSQRGFGGAWYSGKPCPTSRSRSPSLGDRLAEQVRRQLASQGRGRVQNIGLDRSRAEASSEKHPVRGSTVASAAAERPTGYRGTSSSTPSTTTWRPHRDPAAAITTAPISAPNKFIPPRPAIASGPYQRSSVTNAVVPIRSQSTPSTGGDSKNASLQTKAARDDEQELITATIVHEETLEEGLIVGEYGELLGGGTVKRGVKYSADSSVDRGLLTAALEHFLKL